MRRRRTNPCIIIASILFFIEAAAYIAGIILVAFFGAYGTQLLNQLTNNALASLSTQILGNITAMIIIALSVAAGVNILLGVLGIKAKKIAAIIIGLIFLALQVVAVFMPVFNPWMLIGVGIMVLYVVGAFMIGPKKR